MRFFKSHLLPVLLVTSFFASISAHALTVSYGGQAATDGSGLTSAFIPASNTTLPAKWFVETFDPGTAGPAPAGVVKPSLGGASIDMGTGCSINTYGTITTTGGGFGVRQGTLSGVGAAPAGDSTCFGFGPRPGGTLPATFRVDYINLLPAGEKFTYLGLYYGSIDIYNNVSIYNVNTLVRTVTGAEVLAGNGGTSGDQFSTGSNIYVNFQLDPGEFFTAVEFFTSSVAFELDSIVVGGALPTSASNVPEPGSLALLAAGLLGFGAVRRLRKS